MQTKGAARWLLLCYRPDSSQPPECH